MNPFTKDPSIPWYRTRLFWGGVIGVLLAWGIVIYILFIYHPGDSLSRNFTYLSFSLGVFPIGLLLSKVLGEIVSIYIYYFIMSSLLFMTFRKKKVVIVWPILFTIIFLLGHIFGILFLGSFS